MQPLCRVDRQRKVIPGCALELLQRTDLTAQPGRGRRVHLGPLSRGYHIWELKEWATRSELRNAVGGTFDTQLLHAVSESVGMKAESFRGAARAFDDAVSLL